ncbi:MAG: hypothetical protein GY930_22595 [bacterium]|nr:hypothetical protein [bacterium]
MKKRVLRILSVIGFAVLICGFVYWAPRLSALPGKNPMFQFGGFQPDFLDDLWRWDIEGKEWTHLGQLKQPIARAVAVYDKKRDRIVLLGGMNSGSMSLRTRRLRTPDC